LISRIRYSSNELLDDKTYTGERVKRANKGPRGSFESYTTHVTSKFFKEEIEEEDIGYILPLFFVCPSNEPIKTLEKPKRVIGLVENKLLALEVRRKLKKNGGGHGQNESF
jgi:hypothetical protein